MNSAEASDAPPRGMMKLTAQDEITPEQLRSLLRYEPEAGKLYWRTRPDSYFMSADASRLWNERYSGKEAFTTLGNRGYRYGQIFGRTLKAHRVVWAILTGSWPDDQIDHINGVRDDNRANNLRPATHIENCRNTRVPPSNTSGIKGVCWNRKRSKWVAQIKILGKSKHLGYFNEKDAAALAYEAAAREYFGEFASPAISDSN